MPGLDANTKLLMHMDGSDAGTTFPDSSTATPKGDASVTADVNTVTAVKKWGTASADFDGDSGYLTYADSADWDLVGSNTDDWTIDFWVKHTDHVGNECYICQAEDASNYWFIYHIHGSGLIFTVAGGATTNTGYGGEITDTDWHHVALCKVADEYAIYKDGTQVNYTQDSGTDTFAGDLTLGQIVDSYWFDGNIDELRIQKSNYFSAAPIVAPYTQFKCNDDAASTVVTDDGSGANNGTSSTNTSNLSVVGKINDAFEFTSASSEYINTDNLITDIGSDTVGTFAFWWNPDDEDAANNIIVFGDTDGDAFWKIFTYLGKLYVSMQVDGSNAAYWICAGETATATWQHFAVVQDGSALKIYRNGVDITPTPSLYGTGAASDWISYVSAADNGRIGCSNSNNGGNLYFADGLLDDLRYYQAVALTQAQVQEIYNSGSGTESKHVDTITVPTEAYGGQTPRSKGYIF